MADNFTFTQGLGKTGAADDIGGVLYPRVKVTWGADGAALDVSTASGAALPVQVRSSTGLLPIGEPTDAKSTATDTTSVPIVSILKQVSFSVQALVTALGSTALDLGSGTAGTRTLRFLKDTAQWIGGAGAVTSAVQRVTHASDDPAVATLGATSGAAVITDATGTIQQYLRGLVKRWVDALGAGTAAAALRVTFASDAPAVKTDHTSTGLGHGVTTVTTAGTAVALAGSTAAKWVTVQSQTDNTGWIAVGASGVLATVATGTGVLLAAGASITLLIDNLADVFIDSTVNTDGVRYIYGT